MMILNYNEKNNFKDDKNNFKKSKIINLFKRLSFDKSKNEKDEKDEKSEYKDDEGKDYFSHFNTYVNNSIIDDNYNPFKNYKKSDNYTYNDEFLDRVNNGGSLNGSSITSKKKSNSIEYNFPNEVSSNGVSSNGGSTFGFNSSGVSSLNGVSRSKENDVFNDFNNKLNNTNSSIFPGLSGYKFTTNHNKNTHKFSHSLSPVSHTLKDCISLQDSEMTLEEIPEILNEDLFESIKEENIDDYKYGGYHPISVGDVYFSLDNKYQIIQKLGWGHFSTVWLAKSFKDNSHVAIKFVKSSSNYSEAAKDEIDILKNLDKFKCKNYLKQYEILFNDYNKLGSDFILSLLDDFEISGPNGTHVCMVFELLGENILNILSKFKQEQIRGIPKTISKPIIKQLLLGLDYIHHCGIIHTDLKPENILLNLKSSTKIHHNHCYTSSTIQSSKPICQNLNELVQIKIADLGNASYSHKHFTDQIQTRQYRSPEIILKHKTWGASTDLWSVGCIIFELITGDYLFDPHDGKHFNKDDDHLAQIIELFGEYPSDDYLVNCKLTPKFFKFDSTGKMILKNIDNLKFWDLKSVFIEKYKFEDNTELDLLVDLIKKCLTYNLDERYCAKSLVNHPWFNYNIGDDVPISELKSMINNFDDIPGYTSTWE